MTMTTRAGGLALVVGVLVVLAVCPARSDWCPTQSAFPGWEVRTSEDVYANWKETNGRKRYPIANLFDGDLTTAWVFEGKKWDRRAGELLIPDDELAGEGGAGHWIEVCSLDEGPLLVDAVGIVNGYAKSPPIYRRNNRVRRLRIETGPRHRPTVIASADLEPVMWMQIISIPKTEARVLRVVVEAVDIGEDDDLCLSELHLYHRGMALMPKLPPHVVYSPGDECGCGFGVHLVTLRGEDVEHGSPPRRLGGFSYHFFGRGTRVAFYQECDPPAILVCDLTSGERLHRVRLPEGIRYSRWTHGAALRFTTERFPGVNWYELDVSTADAQPRPIEPP